MASFVWVIVLTIVGAMASQTTDPFTQYAMLGVIVLCGIGAVIAFRREHNAQGDLARNTIEKVEDVSNKVDDLAERVETFIDAMGISRDSPAYKEIRAAEQTVRVSLAHIAEPFVATGYAPRIIVTRPDGTIEHDSESDA